jgi:hypothetical protein
MLVLAGSLCLGCLTDEVQGPPTYTTQISQQVILTDLHRELFFSFQIKIAGTRKSVW